MGVKFQMNRNEVVVRGVVDVNCMTEAVIGTVWLINIPRGAGLGYLFRWQSRSLLDSRSVLEIPHGLREKIRREQSSEAGVNQFSTMVCSSLMWLTRIAVWCQCICQQ